MKALWKIVDELGYYPDRQARALVSGQSRIFGLIVPELTNPVFPEIVEAFEEIAFQHNYEALLRSMSHDPQKMELAMRRMVERRVDGVAVLTFGMEESVIAKFAQRSLWCSSMAAIKSQELPSFALIINTGSAKPCSTLPFFDTRALRSWPGRQI